MRKKLKQKVSLFGIKIAYSLIFHEHPTQCNIQESLARLSMPYPRRYFHSIHFLFRDLMGCFFKTFNPSAQEISVLSDGLLRKSLSMLSVMSSVHAITSNVLFFDSFGFLSTCSDLEWSNPLLNAFAKAFSQFTVWRVQMINTDQKIKLDLISKLKAIHFKFDSTGSV